MSPSVSIFRNWSLRAITCKYIGASSVISRFQYCFVKTWSDGIVFIFLTWAHKSVNCSCWICIVWEINNEMKISYQKTDASTSAISGTYCWFWWRLSVRGATPCSWSRRPTRSHVSASTCWRDSARLPSTVRSWRSCVRAPASTPRPNWKHRYSQTCVQRCSKTSLVSPYSYIIMVSYVFNCRPTQRTWLVWWSLSCRNGSLPWRLSTSASEFNITAIS